MDEERFWSLIEQAWPASKRAVELRRAALEGDLEEPEPIYAIQKRMLRTLRDLLAELPREELLAFDRILERKLYDLDREDIHAHTDGSDDGFLYCRGFIVSLGRDFYELVLRDPSRAIVDAELEELCYLPVHLYQEKYGAFPGSDISRETGSNTGGWS